MKAYKIGRSIGNRWPKVVLFLVLAAAMLVVGAVLGVRTLYNNNLKARNLNASVDIVFVVENGDTVEQIAEGLENKEIIRSAWAFKQFVRTKELGEKFIAGTYSLRQSYDVPTIVSYLVEGRVDEQLFTILPGRRLEHIRQAFIDEGFLEADVNAALNPSLYADHAALVDKPAGVSLEGYLYPDSYQRIAETTPQTIVKQSLDEMAEALTPDVRAGIAAQGLSVYQGIILASIVEKEVSGNNPDDRPRVAQVFIKRLNEGIMLQSNATDELPEEYDTYSIEGLPPAPISNVTVSSLKAVAAPANTDFLYFVAGRDCVTRFSHTIDQHEQLQQQHGVARAEDNCI